MILLDYRDPRPIYEQVSEKFKILILKGVLQPGEQMPTVRNLAMELSINPNTIQKAYSKLKREGFICTGKGRGNIVAGSEHILAERKKTCLDNILKAVKEAEEFGMGREEIIAYLRNFD